MNQSAKTFYLVGIITAMLLFMYQLPPMQVGTVELRHVNILCSLLPERENKDVDVIPKPQLPQNIRAHKIGGKTIVVKDVWPKGVTPIEDYSGGNNGGMDNFFAHLAQASSLNRPVRIAYFGDSFIEGDILTADLRELFQQTFGGSGVGSLDVGSEILHHRRSVTQKYNGFTEYMAVSKPFDNAKQGINERYFVPSEGAHASTYGTRFSPHCRNWTSATLYFHASSSLSIKANTSMGVSMHKAYGNRDLQQFVVNGSMSKIDYTFSNVGSDTQILGMSLESSHGVILDNFSMRGSSGASLAKIPMPTLHFFAKSRAYDLIILQFGLNVATPGSNVAQLRYYIKKMAHVVNAFKAAYPKASILIMSVPDRDQRTSNGIRTMQEVKNLVSLQQQLASDCGVAFLSCFDAMGGDESISKLVERNMANKDYTHLSFGGGKYVARKLFPSFEAGLKNYKRRQQ